MATTLLTFAAVPNLHPGTLLPQPSGLTIVRNQNNLLFVFLSVKAAFQGDEVRRTLLS